MPKFEKCTVETEYKPMRVPYLFLHTGDEESWTKTALVKVDDVKRLFDVDPRNEENDLAYFSIYLMGWYSFGMNNPGGRFGCEPHAKVEGKSRKWVRVVQTGGLDI